MIAYAIDGAVGRTRVVTTLVRGGRMIQTETIADTGIPANSGLCINIPVEPDDLLVRVEISGVPGATARNAPLEILTDRMIAHGGEWFHDLMFSATLVGKRGTLSVGHKDNHGEFLGCLEIPVFRDRDAQEYRLSKRDLPTIGKSVYRQYWASEPVR